MSNNPMPPDQGCKMPSEGWYCSREPGHKGPCAARPLSSLGQDWVSRATNADAADMYDASRSASLPTELNQALDAWKQQIMLGEESYDDEREYRRWEQAEAAARSRLEGLFREQREEIERLRRINGDASTDIAHAAEALRETRAAFSSLKKEQLTPTHARELLQVIGSMAVSHPHFRIASSEIVERLRALSTTGSTK